MHGDRSCEKSRPYAYNPEKEAVQILPCGSGLEDRQGYLLAKNLHTGRSYDVAEQQMENPSQGDHP